MRSSLLLVHQYISLNAQAGMRRIIKRLLKKYDYPSKQVKHSLEKRMRQVELMCSDVGVEDLHANQAVETRESYRA